MPNYKRSYCKDCKVLYGKQAIGLILNCTKCGQPLILKSFSPYPKVMGGIIVIGITFITLTSFNIPVIWIGGFILGGSLIINGFKQWGQVKELDNKSKYF